MVYYSRNKLQKKYLSLLKAKIYSAIIQNIFKIIKAYL